MGSVPRHQEWTRGEDGGGLEGPIHAHRRQLGQSLEPGFMLTSLLKQQKYILINWDTHQVLSGCSDDASTDLFVCKKNDTPAEID